MIKNDHSNINYQIEYKYVNYWFTGSQARSHLQRGKTNFFEKRVCNYQKASVAVIKILQLSTMDITDEDF